MIDPTALADRVAGHVPGVRAVLLFGSTLARETRSATSIPDLVAIVDDLDAALGALDVTTVARRLARPLPPITVALRPPGPAGAVAKVNLISFAGARAAFARPDDLSLAGRLAKRTRLLYARDQAAHDETAALLGEAADVMARATILALPRFVSLDEASRRCFALSYRAEPRPETAPQIAARYQAFAADYRAGYGKRVAAAARARGIDVAGDCLVDRRPASARRRDARALNRLLLRSRARTLLRWSRQLLVYRGWLPYLVGKLRRIWASSLLSGTLEGFPNPPATVRGAQSAPAPHALTAAAPARSPARPPSSSIR